MRWRAQDPAVRRVEVARELLRRHDWENWLSEKQGKAFLIGMIWGAVISCALMMLAGCAPDPPKPIPRYQFPTPKHSSGAIVGRLPTVQFPTHSG